ncbi:alpha/beta fold hydrolase [Candidatus Gracilibacteria bacterium]|nr:alpha/beta fold hydrolase [Candidatus Gracilibacteria bacterium]
MKPIVIIGGYLSEVNDYLRMAQQLAAAPFKRVVYITAFGRLDWLTLRDPDFRPALDVLARTVELARRETGAAAVDLVGHSAGGRIARAYLGERSFYGDGYYGAQHVASLTTLGTSHSTSEVWVAQFATWLEATYPGAYYAHLKYRSVAGESVRGRRWGALEEIFAYRSYAISFGSGDQIGDGVVPTASCFLPGADNLVLRGARHTPYNAPNTWYGAPAVVPLWFDG